MPGAVGDVRDQALACGTCGESGRISSSSRQIVLHDLEVGPLVVAADIVRLAGLALLQDQPERPGVVVDEEPVADVVALAVDRQRLAGLGVEDDSGISFSGKWYGP